MPTTATRARPRWFSPFQRFWNSAVELVFPPACTFCGKAACSDLCNSCREHLWPVWVRQCVRCGAPVGPYIDTAKGCIHCRRDRFVFRQATCLGVYKKELQSACRRMKRAGQEPLAMTLGRMLAQQAATVFADSPPQLVVPVPQHWWPRMLQGHNSAETLARVIAQQLGIEFQPHLVVKRRRTLAQRQLSPTRRRNNLRDAFLVRGHDRIARRRVLLVDDVMTTGTTANRIARLLQSAGAETIIVAVVARGLGDARDTDRF